jgi:hypothetical protein
MRRWHIRLSLHERTHERTIVTPGIHDAARPEFSACIHPFISLYSNKYSENPPLWQPSVPLPILAGGRRKLAARFSVGINRR